MSKLEDRIRESHRRIFPVSPPEGAWERLHQDLDRPEKEHRPKTLFGWGFFSGLLTGGLGVYLLLSMVGGPAVAPQTATAPCPEASAAEQTSLAGGIGNDGLFTNPPGTITEPDARIPAVGYVKQEETAPDLSSQSRDAVVPTRLKESSASSVLPEEDPEIAPAVSLRVSRRPTPPLPVPDNPFIDLPITSRGAANHMSRLPVRPLSFTPAADSPQPEKKWTFHRVPKDMDLLPRWEVGGSLLVVPARQRYYGFALDRQASRPGQEMRIVSSPDGRDTLYRGQVTGIADRTHTFNFRSLFLEVGHQFPNGIRLSGGLLGIVSNTRNLGNRLGVLEDLRSSGAATEIITSSERRLIGTLSFQYTFFRRRRFRLSAGLGIVTFLGTRNAETSFIAVGEEVPFQRQTSFSYNNIPFFRTTPLPSLQVQYQLSRHLSLTGDLVPGLGIGLRYGIDSSGK